MPCIYFCVVGMHPHRARVIIYRLLSYGVFPDFLVILVCTLSENRHTSLFFYLLKLVTCKVDHPAGLIPVVPKAGIFASKKACQI